MTRLTIEITEAQKQKLKILAAVNNITMKELILESTIGTKEPNKETLQSFADYKNNHNLTRHSDVNALMVDLNSDEEEEC